MRGAEEQKDVSVDMMSDEERSGEKCICHRPSYCSSMFNQLIDKLDSRAVSDSRAPFPYVIGFPRETVPPSSAKLWVLNPSTETTADQHSLTFFSSDNSSDQF